MRHFYYYCFFFFFNRIRSCAHETIIAAAPFPQPLSKRRLFRIEFKVDRVAFDRVNTNTTEEKISRNALKNVLFSYPPLLLSRPFAPPPPVRRAETAERGRALSTANYYRV